MLSPAMLQNVIFGQNGALSAALLWGALLFAPARPVAAGIGAGLLLLKPHAPRQNAVQESIHFHRL